MYLCIPCGYLYDEEINGQAFDDLPVDWVCPDCQGSKRNFGAFSVEKPGDDLAEIFKDYDIESYDYEEHSSPIKK